jgi:hypothetical protein
MTNQQIKISKITTIIFSSVATIFLLFLYFQNNYLTPLVMHYIYSFGDFVGNRKNLIYIILGA